VKPVCLFNQELVASTSGKTDPRIIARKMRVLKEKEEILRKIK